MFKNSLCALFAMTIDILEMGFLVDFNKIINHFELNEIKMAIFGRSDAQLRG